MRRKILPYNPKLKESARQLRNNSTKSEIYLWKRLSGKQMLGYDFHRQKPIGNYILDFFCHELMLGIELDGYTHEFKDVKVNDSQKEIFLKGLGVTVLRFQDNDIFYDIEDVVLCIKNHIEGCDLHKEHTPGPSQEGKAN